LSLKSRLSLGAAEKPAGMVTCKHFSDDDNDGDKDDWQCRHDVDMIYDIIDDDDDDWQWTTVDMIVLH